MRAVARRLWTVAMLGMDLATLSIPELRRVLDVARARDQADLEKSVLTELRTRDVGPAAVLRVEPAPAEDVLPMEFDPAPAANGAAVWDERPALIRARRAPMVILAASAASVVAVGLGWGLTTPGIEPTIEMRPAVASAPVAPVAPPAPVPAAVEPAAADVEPEARAAPAPVSAPTRVAAKPRPALSSCLSRPTPADRLVCGYPTLGRQHDRMVAAYNRALVMSDSDPQVLDAEQAKWRAVRDRVSDRQKLADLYQQRIRDLDAFAARPAPKPEPKPEREQPIY